MDIMSILNIDTMIMPHVLIILLCLGVVIKETKPFEKVANQWIPLILTIVGIILAFLTNGFTVEALAGGFINAFIATGLYEHFRNTIMGAIETMYHIEK